MLGEELRLSWSMSLGSLLSSSLMLRPSELSPSPSPSHSEGESGRLSSYGTEQKRSQQEQHFSDLFISYMPYASFFTFRHYIKKKYSQKKFWFDFN